jgi:uncharacterized protein YbjT (DUF2867 family)
VAPILVTGGTGVLGRAVVRRLTSAGVATRVLSRRAGDVRADLETGEGLAAAVAGVDTVLHLATTLRGGRDVTITRNLLAATGADRHVVYVSIVGVDAIPLGYYRGKLAAERLVEQVPHTILRATQFHDLLRTLFAAAAKLPLMPVPALRAQPVDVRDVAARLAGLAGGEPQGRVPDFGGPETRTLPDLAAEYLHATGRRRLRVPVRLPGATFRAYRTGANLTSGASGGTITFTEHLRSQAVGAWQAER